MSFFSEVTRCIESMPDDVIIMAEDFAHLAATVSTIYNALSTLTLQGKLNRVAYGVYVKSCRQTPSADDIVKRKALRFQRTISPGEVRTEGAETQFQYSTSGRTTRFKLWLKKGEPSATVLLRERSRAEADRKQCRRTQNPSRKINSSKLGHGSNLRDRTRKRNGIMNQADCLLAVRQLISRLLRSIYECIRIIERQLLPTTVFLMKSDYSEFPEFP
jgi:hypothetical protein